MTVWLVFAMIYDIKNGNIVESVSFKEQIQKPHTLPGFLGTEMPFLEQAMPFYNTIFYLLTFLKSFTVVLFLYGTITWIILPAATYYSAIFFLMGSDKLLVEASKVENDLYLRNKKIFYAILFLLSGIVIGYYGTVYTTMPLFEIVMSQSGR